MRRSCRDDVSNLDVEAQINRFDATWSAVKDHVPPIDFDSDERLEAILRHKLIEIACFNGVSDPEALRDILLARLPPIRGSR